MKNLATEAGWVDVDGVLMDLGVSSPQLDNAERGFSLRMDGPLDMRMDKRSPGTASRFINNASREELERVFRDYGEIRANRRLAKAIVERRRNKPFTTTLELAEACEEALGKSVPGRLPTPTLCFQAVRIAVNRELEELEAGLKSALEILKPGGIMTVISFHSLEDRIVKNFFRRGASECVCPPGFPVCVCGKTKELKILTKKPVKATKAEIEKNSRASCAKLRAMEKTGKGK
jgi:16S rRNA (cytosine1402-N4)-methyltransferase